MGCGIDKMVDKLPLLLNEPAKAWNWSISNVGTSRVLMLLWLLRSEEVTTMRCLSDRCLGIGLDLKWP
jgi:hypothetical protein